jgi:hypothetical protein
VAERGVNSAGASVMSDKTGRDRKNDAAASVRAANVDSAAKPAHDDLPSTRRMDWRKDKAGYYLMCESPCANGCTVVSCNQA